MVFITAEYKQRAIEGRLLLVSTERSPSVKTTPNLLTKEGYEVRVDTCPDLGMDFQL